MTTPVPSPGSDEAIEQGCTCPVMDNGHGRGYLGLPGRFVYVAGCPVHAPAKAPLPVEGRTSRGRILE